MTIGLSNFSGVNLSAMPSIERGQARRVEARRVCASEASLRGYGRLVDHFDPADVTLVPWPVRGRRPLVAGTGAEGGVVSDVFEMERRGETLHAVNRAVGRAYLTGWFVDPPRASASATAKSVDYASIFTHEANYHPDGGQIFFPRDGSPFVALLARAGDDVRPEDFVAFHFDGRRGVHVDPGVWHQPVFPLRPRATFDNAQGRVHACVSVDFVGEFGCYVEVPLAGFT